MANTPGASCKILHSGCRVLHYAGHANDKALAFESRRETEGEIAEPLAFSIVSVDLDQAAVHFADLFCDALINNSGMFTVREAFETAFKTVGANHLNQLKKGGQFLLLPKGEL